MSVDPSSNQNKFLSRNHHWPTGSPLTPNSHQFSSKSGLCHPFYKQLGIIYENRAVYCAVCARGTHLCTTNNKTIFVVGSDLSILPLPPTADMTLRFFYVEALVLVRFNGCLVMFGLIASTRWGHRPMWEDTLIQCYTAIIIQCYTAIIIQCYTATRPPTLLGRVETYNMMAAMWRTHNF